MKQGKMLLFSAPSGSGKTTIVKRLLERMDHLSFSVSATSRNRREGETDRKDYYFLSKDEFQEKIRRNEFLEWEEVYSGQYYGTLKSELERIWSMDKQVVFDIDVKGALNIKKQFPHQSLSIFIAPPSVEELEKRLRARGTETPESLARRIGRAEEELSYAPKFDAVIVNDDLEEAVQATQKLVTDFLARS